MMHTDTTWLTAHARAHAGQPLPRARTWTDVYIFVPGVFASTLKLMVVAKEGPNGKYVKSGLYWPASVRGIGVWGCCVGVFVVGV